jgi:hypothetical protein
MRAQDLSVGGSLRDVQVLAGHKALADAAAKGGLLISFERWPELTVAQGKPSLRNIRSTQLLPLI